ncbi:MAG: serine hydrolase, partial [Actinomycetota bacterium]
VRIEIYRDGDTLGARLLVTGPMASMVDKVTQEAVLLPAGPDLFAARVEQAKTLVPVVFYRLEDGSEYVHMGERATPKLN